MWKVRVHAKKKVLVMAHRLKNNFYTRKLYLFFLAKKELQGRQQRQ